MRIYFKRYLYPFFFVPVLLLLFTAVVVPVLYLEGRLVSEVNKGSQFRLVCDGFKPFKNVKTIGFLDDILIDIQNGFCRDIHCYVECRSVPSKGLPESLVGRVTYLSIQQHEGELCCDTIVQNLQKFPNLEGFRAYSIDGCGFSECLRYAKSCRKLEEIGLVGSPVRPEGALLEFFQMSGALTSIVLPQTKLSTEEMSHVFSIPNLKVIDFRSEPLSRDQLNQFLSKDSLIGINFPPIRNLEDFLQKVTIRNALFVSFRDHDFTSVKVDFLRVFPFVDSIELSGATQIELNQLADLKKRTHPLVLFLDVETMDFDKAVTFFSGSKISVRPKLH